MNWIRFQRNMKFFTVSLCLLVAGITQSLPLKVLLLRPPPVSGVKYCDQRFCMTVCLSVHWYVSKTTYRYPNFTKLSVLVSCYFGPWLGPPHDGNAICSICYVFPVLWMTSCFHMMKQLDQNQAWRYLSSSSPGGGTGDEVCRFRLLFVWYCIKSGPARQNTIIRDSFLI